MTENRMTIEKRRELIMMINAIEHWHIPGIKEQVRMQKREMIEKTTVVKTVEQLTASTCI